MNLVTVDPPLDVATPQILGTYYDQNGITFTIRTVAGWAYDVEETNIIPAVTWIRKSTVLGNGFLTPVRISPSTPANRFYRVSARKQ